MLLRQLFDRETSTYTYLLADETTREALLIDPVLEQVERDSALIRELDLTLRYVLDTHVHADHVSAAGALRERVGAKTVAGVGGAACANRHMKDGDTLTLGEIELVALATPGHTDDSMSFQVGDELFTGDALLVRGTGRTDFQNGDPGTLYDSITRVLFARPDSTRIWPGHDYRGFAFTTVGEERAHNPRVAGKSRAEFITIMQNLGLPKPAQIDRAVPLNKSCGVLNQEAPTPNVRDIEPSELGLLTGVRIVDVREPSEWEGELPALPEAERIPVSQIDEAREHWDEKAPILLVCRSGRRSMGVAQKLVAEGFEHVMNLRGGMLAVHIKKVAP
jgi:sulfur dioxygenase